MSAYSDAELLNRYRQEDDAALEDIRERFKHPLFLFLLGTLRDHHAAEDALQETFIQSLERIYCIDAVHLRGWLFTVAYHQSMLLRRKRAARARHFTVATDDSAESWSAARNSVKRSQRPARPTDRAGQTPRRHEVAWLTCASAGSLGV